MHSFFSAVSAAALCSVVVVACGGEADPGADQEPEAPEVDLSRDFIPGDPDFVRDPALDVSNVSARGDLRSHKSLTDTTFLRDPRFASPFVRGPTARRSGDEG